MLPLPERWARLLTALERPPDPATGQALLAAWGAPGRAYHNLHHLQACLRHLDAHAALAEHPAEVELALWFHDALYDTTAADNEARCAAWARAWLGAGDRTERIAAHILATQHRAPPAPGDEALVVDIDLAILAADPAVYAVFETAVREEYAWVPEDAWRAGRASVLRGFLERAPLYHTPALRAAWEAPARHNLAQALVALGGPHGPNP